MCIDVLTRIYDYSDPRTRCDISLVSRELYEYHMKHAPFKSKMLNIALGRGQIIDPNVIKMYIIDFDSIIAAPWPRDTIAAMISHIGPMGRIAAIVHILHKHPMNILAVEAISKTLKDIDTPFVRRIIRELWFKYGNVLPHLNPHDID